jgi:hypothetical protein
MSEQERLLGGSMKFVNYPDGVIKEVLDLLDNPEEYKKRSEIGKARMGGPGAAGRIAEYIYQNYIA